MAIKAKVSNDNNFEPSYNIKQVKNLTYIILIHIASECSTLCAIVSNRLHPMPCEAESIIVNVAGRLLMFQRDRSGPQLKNQETKERAVSVVLVYCQLMCTYLPVTFISFHCIYKNIKSQ